MFLLKNYPGIYSVNQIVGPHGMLCELGLRQGLI
jgi:hypothetical protein